MNRMFIIANSLEIAIASLAMFVILSGCGSETITLKKNQAKAGPLPKGGGAGAITCVTGLEKNIFNNEFRPLFQANNCTSCHSTMSTKFGLADADAAFQEVKKDADFMVLSDPASSQLILHMNIKHNCGADTNCASLASTFRTGIENWAVAAAISETDCLAKQSGSGM